MSQLEILFIIGGSALFKKMLLNGQMTLWLVNEDQISHSSFDLLNLLPSHLCIIKK